MQLTRYHLWIATILTAALTIGLMALSLVWLNAIGKPFGFVLSVVVALVFAIVIPVAVTVIFKSRFDPPAYVKTLSLYAGTSLSIVLVLAGMLLIF